MVDKNQPDAETQKKNSATLREMINNIPPFHVNLKIITAQIDFTTSTKTSDLVASVSNIHVSIENFSNIPEESAWSDIVATGNLYDGSFSLHTKLCPRAPTLTFDLNFEIKNIDLVQLNDVLRSYAKVDVNSGSLDMFSEIAVSEKRFKGYVKPVLKNLDFIGGADRHDKLLNQIWERIVAATILTLKNDKNDQIATTVPIDGELDDPDVHIGAALLGIFVNAFVKALEPSLDDVVNVKSIWTNVRKRSKKFKDKIFGRGSA